MRTVGILRCHIPGMLVVFLATCSALVSGLPSHEERFVGWQGESYAGAGSEPRRAATAEQHGNKSTNDATPTRWIEVLSWRPRAFLLHHFLTDEECDHMIGLVERKVEQSTVVDSATGKSVLDKIRTSYGSSMSHGQTPIIADIEARIAEVTRLPPEMGEPIQVLRYQNGQKYDAHWDWFHDEGHQNAPEGNRMATVLMYLADVEEGGETTLPLGEPLKPFQPPPNSTDCVQKANMAVKPRKGDALLFYDMAYVYEASDFKLKPDRRALHAACPTLKGTKWTATKWLHAKPCTNYDPLKHGACKDEDKHCKKWASSGMCDTNAATMLGPGGKCRESCNDCVKCESFDLMCQRRNMRSLREELRKHSNAKAL